MFYGRIRSYQIYIPPSYVGIESVPVVIAIHALPSGWLDLKVSADLDKNQKKKVLS